jgi:hypothetical protein
MKNQFNTATPSSTKVVQNLPTYTDDNPSIRQYKPNLIDRVGNLLPDTGPIGVLKGLYKGTDDNLLGLLPSGNYESYSPESDLGQTLSYIADPVGAFKTGKYIVSGGTPVSRLIANSIEPVTYSNKWGELKRVLTNPKVFKEAVIDDIPQYKLFDNAEDRLFAWRKKLGLGKPNDKYNQALDMGQYNAMESAKKQIKYLSENHPHLDRSAYQKIVDDYNQNNPIDRIWNKFGSHTEDGKKYYHYKNPDDYFSIRDSKKWANQKHGLFGGWSSKTKMKGSEELGGVLREDYYDNWDFARNTSLKQGLSNFRGDWKGLAKRELEKLPVSLQRGLAELLLNPLEFKGTAKKIYRKPNPSQAEAMQTVKDYFGTGVKYP